MANNRKYGRGKYQAHDNYIKYMNMLVDHSNFKGMPNARSEDGHINWQVSSGKTTSFYKYYLARFKWWVKIADKLELNGKENSHDRFSIAARIINPTGYRPCRLCGKEYNVGYCYLNYHLANKLNKATKSEMFEKGQSVFDAFEMLSKQLDVENAQLIYKECFPERKSYFDKNGVTLTAFEDSNYVRNKYLSPGFMANPPDRLDGFHDYCFHCRPNKDPGRHADNMRSYNHDRRTFKWWAEGDWLVADALYNFAGKGACSSCGKKVRKISPDHVGPLSCGFKQIPYFIPLCNNCNSSKNRRMTLSDIHSLIEFEKLNNESAASWFVRGIWDNNKQKISSDKEALALSNAMRAMIDFYLRILFHLKGIGLSSFLVTLLSPELALFEVSFTNLDPSTLTFDKVKKKKLETKLRVSLSARIVRIAFEELNTYNKKGLKARKVRSYIWDTYNQLIPEIMKVANEINIGVYEKNWDKIINEETDDEIKEKHISKLLTKLQNSKEYIKLYESMEVTFKKIGGTLPLTHF